MNIYVHASSFVLGYGWSDREGRQRHNGRRHGAAIYRSERNSKIFRGQYGPDNRSDGISRKAHPGEASQDLHRYKEDHHHNQDEKREEPGGEIRGDIRERGKLKCRKIMA